MMSTLQVAMPPESLFQNTPVNVTSWDLANSSDSSAETNTHVETKSALTPMCSGTQQEAQRSSHSPPSMSINAPLQSVGRGASTANRTSLSARDLGTELTTYVVEHVSEFTSKAIEGLIKRLRRDPVQVDHMLGALSTGMKETPCVTFAKTRDGRIQIAKQKYFPSETFFRLFRNPAVRSGDLVALPGCFYGNSEGGSLVCVNPYHYRQRQPSDTSSSSSRRRRRTTAQHTPRDKHATAAPTAAAVSYAQSQWAPGARLEQQHYAAGNSYAMNSGFYPNRQSGVGVPSPYVYNNQFAYLQDPSARMMRAPVAPTLYQHQYYPENSFQVGSGRGDTRAHNFMASQFPQPAPPNRVHVKSESNEADEDVDVTAV
ncbi:hypothetical protein QR680_006365 [Steinernema hermaphroditum]|uniref:MH1 domain-containing protein n=1 Tax=Steinernema hermaphroditum TaxID=289476 RepID=A0AA39LWF3_9BILA|nr:hypothetical protein QR680_006365 [Steinernema hermaphroditum]